MIRLIGWLFLNLTLLGTFTVGLGLHMPCLPRRRRV
jgi:hypothetical protein